MGGGKKKKEAEAEEESLEGLNPLTCVTACVYLCMHAKSPQSSLFPNVNRQIYVVCVCVCVRVCM